MNDRQVVAELVGQAVDELRKLHTHRSFPRAVGPHSDRVDKAMAYLNLALEVLDHRSTGGVA